MLKEKRLEEIGKQIRALYVEQRILFSDARKEKNEKKLGKYFGEWQDTDNSYFRYVYADHLNEEGYILGYYFNVFDNGGVLFSRLNEDVTGYLDEDMPEIPEATFSKVWNECVKNIAEGENYQSNK